MITDDPGTPGNGNWENNLAIAFEHRPNEWSIDAPGIDLNYGWGDHIQLTLQTSLAILKRSDHGAVGGLGGTEAAVKWRFLDEEKQRLRCVDVSAHHFQCRAVFGSARTCPKTARVSRFRFSSRKNSDRSISISNLVPLASTVGRSEWLYGVVGGREVSKATSLMAGIARHFAHQLFARHVGGELRLAPQNQRSRHLDRLVRPRAALAEDEELALIGYCGVQLLSDQINALLKPASAGRSGSTRRLPPGAPEMRCNG